MKSPKPLFFSPTVELFLLSCVALVVLILISIGLTQRLLLRIGVRNMLRRRGQALLLMGGLVLSSAFITASFALNDSIQQASDQQLLGSIGTIDITVTGAFSEQQAASYITTIRQHEPVQAATSLLTTYHQASVTAPETGFSRDRLNVVAVPPDFDQVFGPVLDNQGQRVHFADLHAGEIYLSATLAQNIPVQVGDQVDLNLAGRHILVKVRALLGTDIATNGTDIIFPNPEQVILPLSYYQQIMQQPGAVNTIALRNVHREDDSAGIANFLRGLFHIPVQNQGTGLAKTNLAYSLNPVFNTPVVNVINPDLIYYLGTQTFTNGLGSGSAQFTELAPALSILLVGTGMFLLTLLFILLATERRVELGISRALGFTRSHMIGTLLIEGCGYGIISTIPGILAGIGLVALELHILSFIPLQVGVKSIATIHLSLPIVINWQSLLAALSLSVLTTFVVVLCTAIWISRLTIVAAIRSLPDTREPQASLWKLLTSIIWPQFVPDQTGNAERLGTRQLRRFIALWGLVCGLFTRGPLCLLLALLIRQLASTSGQSWLDLIGLALLIAALGLLLGWLVRGILVLLKRSSWTLATRLSLSLIGLGWLASGIQPGGALLSIFQSSDSIARQAGSGGLSVSALEIVQTNLLLVAGAVLLVMANSDLLIALLTSLLSRVRGLAPISRISLVYPFTYRFRTTMTVSLLGMIVFLIMLVVTVDIGAVQQANVSLATGGFHFSTSGRNMPQDFPQQLLANTTLRSDVADVAVVHSITRTASTGTSTTSKSSSSSTSSSYHWLIKVPGQYPQDLTDLTDTRIMGFSDNFFRSTSMPMQARAQGYTSDQAVWDAVRTHSDYAVWRYDNEIHGINSNLNGFQPFTVQMVDGTNHIHTLHIIGLVASSTFWPYLYVSESTLSAAYHSTSVTNTFTFLLRLHDGISEEQAKQDIMKVFGARYTLQIQSLTASSATASLANLTVFFGCYLALGLIFGALALGVIMSRAVVERRQHIGMLRAFGFSRTLVMCAFLLEASFLMTLSLVIGTTLALWSAYQLTGSQYAGFLPPIPLLAAILLGYYIVAFLATILPAQKAARIYPCEALRYE